MNIRTMLVAVVLLVNGTAAAIAQDEHVAIIKNASGNVEIVRDNQVLPAVPGMQLMRRDKVVSGQDASAGIVFIDGTRITVGSSTEIELSQYLFEPKAAKYDFSLYLRRGTAIYSSGRLGKLAPEAVDMKTPRATVGIRGTRFMVKVD